MRKKKSKQKKEKVIKRFPVPLERTSVYQRDLDPEGDNSLARLVRRIPEGSRVLELGPATGYCSRYLHEARGCTIDAVELSAKMAERARPWCRRLVVGDIETLDLDQAFSGESYHVILCADVLEHLRDPWSLCARLADRLSTEGRLLLSVPNVGYLGLLVDLLRGNFRYRDEGLLDRTHLRFFTFDSLRELLEHTGWHIWGAEQVILSLTDSEFRVRLESLSPALRDELLARSDALCYQWVVEARRIPPPHPVALVPVPPEDRFQVRVFWRDGEAHFDYGRNRLCWAALGRERQSVVLEVPAGQRALALRLSDRVSFIRLHSLRLVGDSDVSLWDWKSAQSPLPLAGTVGMEACGDDGLWFVTDTESRLILDLPIATVAAARKIVVELGAPVSGDYLAAKAYWENPDGLAAQLVACRAGRERLIRRHSGEAKIGEPEPVRPRVLHILPAVGGGIERFVRDLCDATADRFDHFVLRVTANSWLIEETRTASYLPLPGDAPNEVLHRITELAPNLLHLHSATPAPARAARLLGEASGAPLAITLHDVLFADPQAFHAEGWSDTPLDPNPESRELLSAAAFVTAPSEFVANLARSVYGVSVTVVPNGILPPSVGLWEEDGAVSIGGRFWTRRVAVLGALGGHKGGDHLFEIASRLPEDVVVVVIGYLDGQLATGWAHEHHSRLATHPGAARIFVSGPYAPADLPALFQSFRPQLVYFPGLIPESFGYTLSEVWACGGIPVVPDLGALGERVTDQTGISLSGYRNSDEVAKCLDHWSGPAARERRQALRATIRTVFPDIVPSMRATAKTFSELYGRFAAGITDPTNRRGFDDFSELCEMNLDPAQFRAELMLLLEEDKTLRDRDQERARWIGELDANIAALQAANSALLDQDQKRTQWIGKLDADIATLQEANSALGDENQKRAQWIEKLDAHIAALQEAANVLLDQDQKRAQWIGKLDADIATLQEANSALGDENQKRGQWIGKLDADIAGLNAHIAGLDARIADSEARFATTVREQANAIDRQRQDLEERDARLATARAALGEDESVWLRYGRVVRLSRKIPGLLAAIDRLVAMRRGLRDIARRLGIG